MDTGTTTPAPDAPTPGTAVEVPGRARRLRPPLIIGAALLLAVVAAVIGVALVNHTVLGPARAVEAYLDALVAGEAEKSRTLIGDGEGAPAILLSDAVYRSAEDRLTGYEVRDVTVLGDTATVAVELMQNGAATRYAFELTRTGRTAFVLDEWRLDGPEPLRDIRVLVDEGLGLLTVNGVGLALPPGGAARYPGLRSVTLPALPGRYVVSPPAPSAYLSYGSEQQVVVPVDPRSAPSGVLLEPAPTPAAEAEAVDRVEALLNACIASSDAAPAGCPNRSFLFGDPEDVRAPRWTLDRVPTYSLEKGYDPGVYRLTGHDAQATFSYERNIEFGRGEPARWTREEDPQPLLITATVTVSADELDVNLDPDAGSGG